MKEDNLKQKAWLDAVKYLRRAPFSSERHNCRWMPAPDKGYLLSGKMAGSSLREFVMLADLAGHRFSSMDVFDLWVGCAASPCYKNFERLLMMCCRRPDLGYLIASKMLVDTDGISEICLVSWGMDDLGKFLRTLVAMGGGWRDSAGRSLPWYLTLYGHLLPRYARSAQIWTEGCEALGFPPLSDEERAEIQRYTLKQFKDFLQRESTEYLVLDLGRGGDSSKGWPWIFDGGIDYLDSVPETGWTDEFKEEKIVLHKIPGMKGQPPVYMAIFPLTRAQVARMSGGTWEKDRATGRLPYVLDAHIPHANAEYPRWFQELAKNDYWATLFSGTSILTSSYSEFTIPFVEEWEHACRGGANTRLGHGSSDNLDSVAWTALNSGGHPHPVGEKSPNQYGFYDMQGNEEEFCGVRGDDSKCASYVLKGGNYNSTPAMCDVSSFTPWTRTRKYSNWLLEHSWVVNRGYADRGKKPKPYPPGGLRLTTRMREE